MRQVYILIALTSAALAAFAIWMIMDAPRPLDPRIVQAVAAGALVGIGWSVTFLMQEYRRWRERGDVRVDIEMALRAEISDAFADNDAEALRAHGARMAERILSAGSRVGEAFHVFVPKPVNLTVFQALSERIHYLDSTVIDPVIWYYSQAADVIAFAEDLRSREYRALSAERRAKAYAHYVEMQIEAVRRRDVAITALTAALGDQDEVGLETARMERRAERMNELRAWLNSRAAGRSAP